MHPLFAYGLNGSMQGVGSKGTLTTPDRRGGANHMGQFNAGTRLDWTGIGVRTTNDRTNKLFMPC